MSSDVDPGRQVTTGGAGDLGRRVLPVLLLVVAIAMQAGGQGTLTTRIDPGGSLLFTAVAFLTATVVFGGLNTAGRRRPGSRLAAAPRPDRRSMVALNAATAVTFLAFYVSLSLVPASTTSALEAAFGPVCVLLLTRAVLGRRAHPATAEWVLVGVLGLTGLVLAGWTLAAGTGATSGLLGARVLGLVLAAAAGAGMAAVTLLSRRLGLAGASSVTVTAHRFHLTYLLAVPLWLTQDPRLPGAGELLTLVALGLAAVAVPLYLLQVGMQRVDPMTAMAVIVTLPGMTYVVELAAGGGYDTVTLALLCLVMATAAGYALISVRRPPLVGA